MDATRLTAPMIRWGNVVRGIRWGIVLSALGTGALIAWPSVWAADEAEATTTGAAAYADVLKAIDTTQQTDPALAAQMRQELHKVTTVDGKSSRSLTKIWRVARRQSLAQRPAKQQGATRTRASSARPSRLAEGPQAVPARTSSGTIRNFKKCSRILGCRNCTGNMKAGS